MLNINRPENLFFFVVWRRILGFRWLVWIGVIQRGREFDHFMLGKVTDYVPRSILWTFQLVRIFLYFRYIYIYTHIIVKLYIYIHILIYIYDIPMISPWYLQVLANCAPPRPCIRRCSKPPSSWRNRSGFRESRMVQLEEITLWWFNVAIENGPLIVDFPIKNGDFPYLC